MLKAFLFLSIVCLSGPCLHARIPKNVCGRPLHKVPKDVC